MGERLTEAFMQLFCEKNSDGTRNLRLKGRDLWQRIGTRINDNDMKKVAKFLKSNLKVVKLDLCYNNVGDKGIEYLVGEYLSNKRNTLEHLNLANCNITGEGMKVLHTAVETLRLKTLRINGNKLGYDGGRATAEILLKCPTLIHVDIGDADQTLATVKCLMGAILANDILQILDFSRVIPLRETYQYNPGYLADAVGELLRKNTSLVELHIQKNQFDGHDVEMLLYGLERNTTLLLLDLGFNRIGDHGIELLAKWLKTRPPLVGLNIAGNGIHDTGARSLSFGLPYSKVRLLDITHNRIGDKGMLDILYSIKKPYMLRLFYFWGNNFGHSVYPVIERMLRSGVLVQDQIDIKIYTVDNAFQAAYYPTNHYKHRYYCVMDHGCPIELRIKRNKIEHIYARPRALVNFQYYDRFPNVDESLPPGEPPCGLTYEM